MSISNIDVDVLRTDSVKYNKGGSGFDLGFTYQKTLENCDSYLPHTPKSSCRYIPYKYKLGISLIDVGSVKFEQEKINYNGYNFDFENIAKQIFRVTKQGGVLVWVTNDATINGSETGTSYNQVLFFKSLGFNIHDTMIFKKRNLLYDGKFNSFKLVTRNISHQSIF